MNQRHGKRGSRRGSSRVCRRARKQCLCGQTGLTHYIIDPLTSHSYPSEALHGSAKNGLRAKAKQRHTHEHTIVKLSRSKILSRESFVVDSRLYCADMLFAFPIPICPFFIAPGAALALALPPPNASPIPRLRSLAVERAPSQGCHPRLCSREVSTKESPATFLPRRLVP